MHEAKWPFLTNYMTLPKSAKLVKGYKKRILFLKLLFAWLTTGLGMLSELHSNDSLPKLLFALGMLGELHSSMATGRAHSSLQG